jgi:hypothetical protein
MVMKIENLEQPRVEASWQELTEREQELLRGGARSYPPDRGFRIGNSDITYVQFTGSETNPVVFLGPKD